MAIGSMGIIFRPSDEWKYTCKNVFVDFFIPAMFFTFFIFSTFFYKNIH